MIKLFRNGNDEAEESIRYKTQKLKLYVTHILRHSKFCSGFFFICPCRPAEIQLDAGKSYMEKSSSYWKQARLGYANDYCVPFHRMIRPSRIKWAIEKRMTPDGHIENTQIGTQEQLRQSTYFKGFRTS